MLKRALDIIEFGVECTDGYAGFLRDLYFDDWEWNIRYLVVEITDPQNSLRTLIAPLSVKKIDYEKRRIYLDLDLDKIRNSPEIDTDLPISRQYEIALRRYYEWPTYWQNTEFQDTPEVKGFDEGIAPLDDVGRTVEGRDNTLDLDDQQITDTSMEAIPSEPDDQEDMDMELGRSEESVEYSPELRSFMELRNYRVQTADSDAPTVDNIIIDDETWSIAYLAVKLHNSSEGKFVLLTLHWVETISWSTTRVFASLTQEQLENAPAFTTNTKLTREYEQEIYKYYDSF